MAHYPLIDRVLERTRDILRTREYSPRTEEVYLGWIERFLRFHRALHPMTLERSHVESFLQDLAVRAHLAPKSRNQAAAALSFLMPFDTAVASASAIFSGRVASVGSDPRRPDATPTHFELMATWKGSLPQRVLVWSLKGGEGYPFREGGEYLVHVRESDDSTLWTSVCTRTAPLDRASEDLARLGDRSGQ